MAQAYHEQGEGQEVVGISALKVLVDGNDIDGWMAQGLEIDYFVCGKTEESVKKNFVEGLVKTIGLYLLEEGTIESLLKPAPMEVWKEYFQAMRDEQKAVSVEANFVATVSAQTNLVIDYPLDDLAFVSSRKEAQKVPV